ncbi:MAG: hypothetical protein JXM71_09790 [Spirochaetales bacterium]|nr:hypothetical protein [Spirochaetales bacterium]
MTSRPAVARLLATLLATLFAVLLVATVSAEEFSFSADSMSGAMAAGRERAVLIGNAVVVSGAMRIRADRIELSGDEFRFADCSGRVTVVDDERGLRLTTERLFYDRRDKIARLTGPSVMEDRENEVVIKGDYIENDDERKIAVVQINARILKKNISCRAEFARYDRAANTLELSGSPVVWRDGDDYRAASIFVNLDTEDIVLSGSVSGTVAAAGKDSDDDAPPADDGGSVP